jgi:restriction system protein
MQVWLVRAGRYGEREQFALDNGCAVVGWEEMDDMSTAVTREDLLDQLRKTYPEDSEKRLINYLSQLWAFTKRMNGDDIVVLPLKSKPALALGRVTGHYQYRPDYPYGARHTRPVEWIRTDVPRSAVGQDLLYSLGAFMTVCEIQRNNAVERLKAVLNTGHDPGAAPILVPAPGKDGDIDIEQVPVDVQQYATDQIRAFVAEKFTGHGLARLVEAILRAEGFVTFLSPPGADGGLDVLAGSGPLGMDSPRICVQVKSGDSPVDVKVIRELQGVRGKVTADQGLLVAWGGLTKAAEIEARTEFFRLRVWTADDVIDQMTRIYDRLPEDLQADLPLKRVWTVVLDEAAG